MEYQSDQDKAECEQICKRQEQMQSERSNWETTWQDCMEHIVPRKNDVISTSTPGEKKGHELFDTTAIMSNQLLAGALHSMLTNQATKFFDLVMGDPELDDDDEVREWLQEVADRKHTVINNSNFQTEVHEVYIDLGAIGTAAMFIGEHEDRILHFAARAMKEIYVRENNLGLIDTVHRIFSWTPRQIIQEFGEEEVPEIIRKKFKEGSEDKCQIIHVVEPSTDKESPWAFKSVYVLKEEKLKLCKDKGFKEFPFVISRWTKTSGETYGRGPGMDMLPDIKMVNKMMETTLKGAQKTVDPPLMVQDDGVVGRVRLTPSGLTVVRDMERVPIRPLITDGRIDFGYQAVEDVRKRIRSGFYVDQLQLNEGPQMTATEVNQRTEEKLRLMGPVLGRQHFEFLRPMIERVFGIMSRRGLVPEAPAKIRGKKFDVRYSSLVARAQRMSDGANIIRAVNASAPIIDALPSALDNLDGDAAVKYIMEIYGVPQKVMRDQREIKRIRESRAEAEQQAAREQQEAHQADVVAKVGPTAVQAQQGQR